MADYYDVGTITVPANSRIVTGAGTSWAGVVRAGDVLEIGGRQMRIASVETGTSLTLKLPAPAAASGAYAIWYEAPSRTSGMQALADMRRQIEIGERLLPMRATYEVRSATLNAPPASPVTSDMYLIGTAPTGAWTGRAGHLAQWTGTGWAYIAPQAGMGAIALDTGRRWGRDLTSWGIVPGAVSQLAVSGNLADATGVLPVAGLPEYLRDGSGIATATLSSHGAYVPGTQTFDWGAAPEGFRGLVGAGFPGEPPRPSGVGFWWVEQQRIWSASGGATGLRQIATGYHGSSSGAGGPVMFVRTSNATGVWTRWNSVFGERGINANGEFVRLADGLQICTGTVSLTSAGSVTASGSWIYPAPFVSSAIFATAHIVAGPASGIRERSYWGNSPGTASCAFSMSMNTTFPASFSENAVCVAVGRWL